MIICHHNKKLKKIALLAPATTTQAPAAAATSSQQAAPVPAAASTTQAANSPVASNIPSAVASGNSTLAVNGSMIATAILPSGNSTNNSAAANSLAALPTSASYGNSVYPGTATFLTPTASKSVSPLYRIDNNENVTFVWQFTDLLVRPQNLTLAAVAPNSVTYTISAGLPGDTTSAVWQIKNVPAASPLMMGMYQVQLYDQRGPTAAPLPGWLMPVTRLTIAFYSAESYQPLTGSKCFGYFDLVC